MAGNVHLSHIRVISVPEQIQEVLRDKKVSLQKYIDFEELLFNDSIKANKLFEFKRLIKEICSYCSAKEFPIVVDEFKTVVSEYRIKKKEELQYDKESQYLTAKDPENPKGSNKWVKAEVRDISRKLNMIDELESFLKEYSKKEPSFKAPLSTFEVINQNHETENKNMFVVSNTKRKFSDYDLKSITTHPRDKEKHKYALLNGKVYHKETGELLKEESRTDLNTLFILELDNMYVLEVNKFLNYQYTNSKNKTDLFRFIKYGVLHSKIIKHEGTKDQIKDWIKEIENNEQSIKQSSDQPHRESNDLDKDKEPNDFTLSTIEDWLCPFKEEGVLTETNYKILVDALNHYFKYQTFPKLETVIKVGRINKKRFGWHLNRIFHSEGKGVEVDLLRFAKMNISIFKDVDFDENDLQSSNLYKYFTTKTK